jgi:NPCBM-associated, NEW3 domain of alpha-galactosidase
MNKRKRFTGPAIVLILVGMFIVAALPKAVGSMSTNASAQSVSSIGQVSSADEGRRSAVRDATTRLVEMSARYQSASEADRPFMIDDLRNVAATRRQMLEQLMESEPAEVLRVALPEGLRSSVPAEIAAGLEQQVSLEGELEVLYECGDHHSRLLYFLKSGDERISLHFVTNPSTDLQTGSRVRVRGIRVGESLALESSRLERSSPTGLRVLAATLPNTFGTHKVLVILVNFQDKQTQPYTVDYARNVVFGTTNNFYQENSYGQTSLTGDVVGWYTISESYTTCNTSNIASKAKAAAQAAGVNLSGYNHFVYAFPEASCTWWGWGTYGGNPSSAWISGSFELQVVGHELGHNFGLYHSRSLDCGAEVVSGTCTYAEYGDILDLIGGNNTKHFNAYQKERLGWLGYNSSPPITTVQASGTYWLDTYESVGSNPKALKVLKSTDPTTGKKTWYYMECRRAIGFDSPLSSNVSNGVVVHTGSESSATEIYLLDMTPQSSNWNDWGDPALDVGQSFTDANAGVTITTLSSGSTGAAVNVSFGPLACTRSIPTAAISPSQSQWVPAGTPQTFTVSVTNNDTAGCTASSFNLSASVPSGWTSSFFSPTLNIAPGTTASTTLQVTSPLGATDGFYNVGVAAANSSATSYSASASATYVIVSSLSVAVSTNQSSYSRNQTVSVTTLVSVDGLPISGTAVTFSIKKSSGAVVTGSATTGTNGSAVYKYKLKRNDPVGAYQASAAARMNALSGTATTNFMVQ